MSNKRLSGKAIEIIALRFKVLSEPIRLQMVYSLRNGEKSVNELTEVVRSSQPNVSKHLKMLLHEGVLKREKEGNTVYYSIADESIFDLCETVCGALEAKLKKEAEVFAGV